MRTATLMRRFLRQATGAAILSLGCVTLAAQPVRDRILQDVRVEETPSGPQVKVTFSPVMRYVTHFPEQQGQVLRILLAPVLVGSADRSAIRRRESVQPPGMEAIGLTDLVYEGDIEGGPFLTLYFKKNTGYEVLPGADTRSLTVVIHCLD